MSTSPHIARRRAAAVVALALLTGLFVAGPSAPASAQVPGTEARDVVLSAGPARALSAVRTLPIRANMLGVTWSGGEARIEVRMRSIGSQWSGWEPLAPSDIAPDRGSGEGSSRRATEPKWVRAADRIALRLDAAEPVSDVRLHLINTLGDARPPSTLSRIARALGSVFAAPPRAGASPAIPAIRSRAQWGADERWRRCCPRYAQTVEVAFVHHTVSPNNYTAAQAPGMIRAIYRYHRFNLDYDDIAYNFLVDRFGVVYEGRAGGTRATVIGAHTEGMNSKTTGIALLGTFSSAYASSAMMVSLQKLLAWKLDVHHIPPSGVVPMTSGGSAKLRRGQTVNMPRIAGHRDAQATDCPGNRIYYQLGRIRSTIQPWGAPKFYLNSSGRVLRIDGDLAEETVPVKVWMSSSLNWQITFSDASGNARKTFTGTGTVADVVWDGRDAVTGRFAQTGVGQIRIEVSTSSGVRATPAVVPLYVVAEHLPATVVEGEAGRLLLEPDAVARPIPTDAVFTSWYRDAEAVPVTPAEIARYRTTLPITYRDGTLVRTPDGTYHFISGGTRRTFASPAIFDALGYTEAAALPATQAEVEALPQGTPITDAAIHPNGAVVRDGSEQIWLVENGARRKVPNGAVRRSWFRDAEIVAATAGDATLPEGVALGFRPGALFRTPDGIHWQMVAGTRKSFYDPWFFAAFGYPSGAALSAEWSEILIVPYGGQIK